MKPQGALPQPPPCCYFKIRREREKNSISERHAGGSFHLPRVSTSFRDRTRCWQHPAQSGLETNPEPAWPFHQSPAGQKRVLKISLTDPWKGMGDNPADAVSVGGPKNMCLQGSLGFKSHLALRPITWHCFLICKRSLHCRLS